MPRAFLLMPFRPEFAELHRVIVEAGTQVGVEVVRADDIFAGGVVVDQVRRQIYEADAVIAVCTDRNRSRTKALTMTSWRCGSVGGLVATPAMNPAVRAKTPAPRYDALASSEFN